MNLIGKQMKIEYPSAQTVSIWIGTFPTENDFDQSVDEDVAKRLGLKISLESICEISFEEKPIDLFKLLEGFSGWEAYINDAVFVGRKRGVEIGNAALVCYYLKCENAPLEWGRLHFLGSFIGHDID
ncbi:MAG TPA: hypothetical protein VH413_17225 [Verrucomicrobiae bacterium]|jgi:hypothetical protein|nr:hypothetical protein [Verrucomicrobiae bacterium]